MSLKEKIRVVLNQNGKFVCPNGTGTTTAAVKSEPAPKPAAIPATQAAPKVDNYAVVLADLKKRGASQPRKIDTLKNTIRDAVKNAKGSLTDAQLETLFKHLQVNGKITVDGTKVSYSL